MSGHILYVRRSELNGERWNSRIDSSSNGLIYAYSYYLDQMSPGWSALVKGNYEYVMPLTWRRKAGFSYLYQPAFTPVLGVFGDDPSMELVQEFVAVLIERYRLIEISFNYQNRISQSKWNTVTNSNFILDLNFSYDELFGKFKENIRRNIRKALQFSVEFRVGVPIEEVIALSSEQMMAVSNVRAEDFRNVAKLFDLLKQSGKAESYGVYSIQGQLLASCVFFFSHQRAYYILVGNHPDGRSYGASHYLIDRFINLHAGSRMILDFEGSDIKNLAYFYQSFGSTNETYYSLRVNRLPGIIKLLKNLR